MVENSINNIENSNITKKSSSSTDIRYVEGENSYPQSPSSKLNEFFSF
jgi:hypothetical protein